VQDDGVLLAHFDSADLSTNWNEMFQRLFVDVERSLSSPHELRSLNTRSRNLAHRFAHHSRQVAVKLVEQLQEPRSTWLIQPLAPESSAHLSFRIGYLHCTILAAHSSRHKQDVLEDNLMMRRFRHLFICHRLERADVYCRAELPSGRQAVHRADVRLFQSSVDHRI